MRKLIKLNQIILLILMMFFSCSKNINDSRNIGIKGSFMIAAIGNDGIIVATETRGNVFDNRDTSETPIAYYDGVQKEFIIGNNVLASTGKGAIGNVLFSALVSDFKNNLSYNPKVDEFFHVLNEYSENHIPPNLKPVLFSNLMLVAGYQYDKPTICYFQNQTEGCIENEGYVESDKTSFKNVYDKRLSCEVLSELAEKAIIEYSRIGNNWQTIGEDICIIKIAKDSVPTWRQKVDFHNWTYTHELIRDYSRGTVKLNLIEPNTKSDLDSLFFGN